MRIVNAMYISKEKAVGHYVDLIVKVFQEISKLLSVWGFECQLKTPKSGVCLDQNWMFVRKVGVQILDFFCRRNK